MVGLELITTTISPLDPIASKFQVRIMKGDEPLIILMSINWSNIILDYKFT